MLANLTFGIGAVCFAVALLPTLRSKHKPAFATCAITSFWLWAYAITYLSLRLYFAAVTTGISALLWTNIGMQAVAGR